MKPSQRGQQCPQHLRLIQGNVAIRLFSSSCSRDIQHSTLNQHYTHTRAQLGYTSLFTPSLHNKNLEVMDSAMLRDEDLKGEALALVGCDPLLSNPLFSSGYIYLVTLDTKKKERRKGNIHQSTSNSGLSFVASSVYNSFLINRVNLSRARWNG